MSIRENKCVVHVSFWEGEVLGCILQLHDPKHTQRYIGDVPMTILSFFLFNILLDNHCKPQREHLFTGDIKILIHFNEFKSIFSYCCESYFCIGSII